MFRCLALALALAALSLTDVRAAHAEVRWETNFARATSAARETNRPMLVEFWATWCETCAAMDANVYSDGRVASAMSKVIPVRVDIDREPGISRKYEISGTPTLMLMDAYGNELFRFTGSLSLDRVVQLLGELPADISRINRLSGSLASDRDRFDSVVALGRELRAEGFYVASNRYFARAIRARDTVRGTDARAAILVEMGRNHLDLNAFEEAVRTFDQAMREKPGGQLEPDAMLGSGKALLALGKKEQARRMLEALTTRYKGTPASAEGARLLGGGSGR
jgi:thioredoxin-like negative regulator of GroEL